MNDLPKPTTPPAKTDGKQQTVVFDQSKKTAGASPGGNTTPPAPSDPARIPLAQKPVVADADSSGSAAPSSTSTTPSTSTTKDSSGSMPPSALKSTTPAATSAQTNPGLNLGSPEPPAQAPKPTLPPTSLSALSSMSSNKIPSVSGGANQAPPVSMPQKTVLGQPIPQAIRGEATPVGIGKPAPGMAPPKPPMQVGSPRPGNAAGATASSATNPTSESVKQENPNIGSKNEPQIAQVKSPIMKFLPFIAGGILLLVVIIFVLSRLLGGSSATSVANNQATPPTGGGTGTTNQAQRTEVPAQRTTIEYWGLWEPSEVMEEVITGFETENPGVEINYVKQSHVDYRERLQTALQSGTGPDIFRFHASWVPMLKSSLDPIPASVVSAADFRNNYYPVVTEQLVSAGQYVGLPVMYDGLVLYYNEDILATASETPPKTWPELRTLAVKLTVPSASGIQRGGLAIGNATNVEHFSDILATLILQNGGNLSEADSVETRDALLFYTNFQIRDKVWNETLPSSTVAFARGDVAMMFAPSWRAHEIKALNPDLKFSTAPMPQLSEDEKVTWATYWAEGISATGRQKTEAAKFLAYLNRDDILKKFFSEASKVRLFGEIYPKVTMVDEFAEDKVITAILEDAIYAKSGYMNSFTHDNGINDQTISYYKTAIDALIGGASVEGVQATLNQGVSQVLRQYSVSTQ